MAGGANFPQNIPISGTKHVVGQLAPPIACDTMAALYFSTLAQAELESSTWNLHL